MTGQTWREEPAHEQVAADKAAILAAAVNPSTSDAAWVATRWLLTAVHAGLVSAGTLIASAVTNAQGAAVTAGGFLVDAVIFAAVAVVAAHRSQHITGPTP